MSTRCSGTLSTALRKTILVSMLATQLVRSETPTNKKCSHLAFEALAIPSLGGVFTDPVAINQEGVVVGSSTVHVRGPFAMPMRAYYYANGRVEEVPIANIESSNATAVNSSGVIVGSARQSSGAQCWFSYKIGQSGNATCESNQGYINAVSVSDSGLVLLNRDRSVLLHQLGDASRSMRTLGFLQHSVATGQTSKGQIFGRRFHDNGVDRAFTTDNGRLVDIGTLGGERSAARSGDSKGQVVGWAETGVTDQIHAFIFRKGKIIDLSGGRRVSSVATGIAEDGSIVGYERESRGRERAVIWEHGIVLRPLNDVVRGLPTDLTLTRANAINNKLQIVAQAELVKARPREREVRAFLLNPLCTE